MRTLSLIFSLLACIVTSTTFAAEPPKYCRIFLKGNTIYFPEEGPSSTFAFLETKANYVFHAAHAKDAKQFLKKDYQSQIVQLLEQRLGKKLTNPAAELWLRASSGSTHMPNLAIVIRSTEGSFLLAPPTLDPSEWSADQLNLLVDTDYPKTLGYFPKKVTIAFKKPLKTQANVEKFQTILRDLGVTDFNFGHTGPEKAFHAQVLTAEGNERKLVAALSKHKGLKKWIHSAERSSAGSLLGFEVKLAEFNSL